MFGGKKEAGSHGTSRDGGAPNRGLIWAAWLLSTAGFAILLGGVASMQHGCGAGNNLLNLGGAVGYLAPVSCNKLFRYTWWITFLHFFTWAMILVYLVGGVLQRTRPALVGLLAVTTVLLMDTANTYLFYNDIPGLTGTMATRTKVTIAGAIIAAIADLLLIMLIGWHSDDHTHHNRTVHEEVPGYATTTVPASSTTTTTTAGRPYVNTV